MYTIEKYGTVPAEPVSAAELKTFLRLNTDAEDTLLPDFIAQARQIFETHSQVVCLSQTLRQHVENFPPRVQLLTPGYQPSYPYFPFPFTEIDRGNSQFIRLYLMRTPVTSITAVKYYDQNGTLQTLSGSNYSTNVISKPASVLITNYPTTSHVVQPVAHVEFTAGYANPAAVPANIRNGIKMLAGYLFKNRETHTEKKMQEIAYGFMNVVGLERLGVFGPWGM